MKWFTAREGTVAKTLKDHESSYTDEIELHFCFSDGSVKNGCATRDLAGKKSWKMEYY